MQTGCRHKGWTGLAAIGAVAVLVGLTAAAQAGAEPGFGLPVKGPRTVALSDRVGENQVRFVSTAPLEEIRGTASAVSGSFTFDPADVTSLSGTVAVKVNSMKTGIERRDGHLHSKDWLDAEQFPEIRFKVTGVKGPARVDGDGKARGVVKGTAVGSLTLHGVTKPLRVPVEATYLVASDKTAGRAPGDLVMVKSSFTIALADYDVSGVRGLVGSKVGKVIDVEVALFGSTEPAEGRE